MPQREDESLLEERRATIRADRERAAARGTTQPRAAAPPAPSARDGALVASSEPPEEARKPLLRRLFGR